MAKKAKVQLFGLQNRGIDVNIDATEGATLGRDLFWPDGTLVTQETIINQTIITTPNGPVGVVPTLWELILNIPANIVKLASLATFGFISRIDGSGNMVARSIVGEQGRIKTLDGDGVAGDPKISLGPFPTVQNSIPNDYVYTIPAGTQMLVWDTFTFDGGMLTMDGDLVVLGAPEKETKQKAITIEIPTASEDISFFFTKLAITITSIEAVLIGVSSPSVTWTLRHGLDRSAAGTEAVTGGTVTTNTTTGATVSSFNDATIVAESFIWVETTAVAGTNTALSLTVFYTED